MKNFIARIRRDATKKNAPGKEQIYASDVDYALIVMSATSPKFSSFLCDKYLVLCDFGNVTPVVVLNKVDLSTEIPSVLEYYKNNLGFNVFLTSARNDTGVSDLYTFIQGKRNVLLGKSGVGKSSLINALAQLGNSPLWEPIQTGDVSERYGEGMHTTSTILEHQLDTFKTVLIDTPGLRNIDVSDVSPLLLRELFPDFVALQNTCMFSDCVHVHEKKCGIKMAVESSKIPQERYQNYLKMINVS